MAHTTEPRRLTEKELAARLAITPADTRDFTGRWMGDPIPGDKRRELFPGRNCSLVSWRD